MKRFSTIYVAGIVAVGLAASFSSCKEKDYKIKGTIEGGADKTVVLERPDFGGRWVALDSARIAEDGRFTINYPRPSAPEVYRLALNGRYIYIPVDSTATLTVGSTVAGFGHDFSVAGSPQAEKMAQFEKELLSLDFSDNAKRDEFKRNVYTKYMKDAQGGIISYYALTKTVGDKPLYDINDVADAKYYAAVATSFEQYRPDDPHTQMLKQSSIEALKNKNTAAGRKRVVEAEEIKMIEIELPDETGKDVKLSETVGKGRRGVMIVSMMNEKESPAVNKALSEIYGSGKAVFYMVSLDSDRYAWRDAAKNLPWVTVYDADGRNSGILQKYNIGALPAFFIFDGEGHLADRAFTIDELKEKI